MVKMIQSKHMKVSVLIADKVKTQPKKYDFSDVAGKLK